MDTYYLNYGGMVVDRGLPRGPVGPAVERLLRRRADRGGPGPRGARVGLARAPDRGRAGMPVPRRRGLGDLSRPARGPRRPGRRARPGERSDRVPGARRDIGFPLATASRTEAGGRRAGPAGTSRREGPGPDRGGSARTVTAGPGMSLPGPGESTPRYRAGWVHEGYA